MIDYQIAIAALLLAQVTTLWLLWQSAKTGDWFRRAWIRDSKELLHWKRYAVLRDPKTGKYVRKARR